MSAELINQIKSARRVSVPLVAITTPDPAQTVELICAAVNGDGPRIVWDVVQGLRPRNEIAKEAIALMVGDEDMTIGNPLELLRVARKLMESGVLCMLASALNGRR